MTTASSTLPAASYSGIVQSLDKAPNQRSSEGQEFAKFADILFEQEPAQLPDSSEQELLQSGSDANEKEPGIGSHSLPETYVDCRDPGTSSRYSSKVVIGETAVEFQSRPIVGRTAVAHRSDIIQSEFFGLRMQLAGRRDALPANLQFGLERFELPSILSALTRETQVTTIPQAGSGSTVAVGPIATGAALLLAGTTLVPGVVASPAITGPASLSDVRAAGATEATRPAVPTALHDRTNIFAQLVASDSEYRVIIRGQSLSRDERELLVSHMRHALKQLGLPFHPVQVVMPEREN